MSPLSPELEAEVQRRVDRQVKEQAQALEVSGLARELRSIKRWMVRTDRRLNEANHLKEQMVTKERFSEFEAKLDSRLAFVVKREDLEDGDYVVHAGVVTSRDHKNAGDERKLRRREVWAAIAIAGFTGLALIVDVAIRIIFH